MHRRSERRYTEEAASDTSVVLLDSSTGGLAPSESSGRPASPESTGSDTTCGVCMCVGLVLLITHLVYGSVPVCVCVEWVLHTTHGVYGFPTNGHTWGITKLDIVFKNYSHLHTLTHGIVEL